MAHSVLDLTRMEKALRIGLHVLLASMSVGCGGAATFLTSPDDAGSTMDGSVLDGAPSDAGIADASPSSDASPPGPCPATVPAHGTECTARVPECEYGGAGDHFLCSTFASCFGGAWNVQPPPSPCVSSPAENPSGCPSSFSAIPTGGACPAGADRCVYAEGVCGCTSCWNVDGGGGGSGWACEAWPQPAGCPEPRPRIGSPCTEAGTDCWYGNPCGVINQPAMRCESGVWSAIAYGVACAQRVCGK